MNPRLILKELEALEKELLEKHGGSQRVLALYEARKELQSFYGFSDEYLSKTRT